MYMDSGAYIQPWIRPARRKTRAPAAQSSSSRVETSLTPDAGAAGSRVLSHHIGCLDGHHCAQIMHTDRVAGYEAERATEHFL